MKRWNTPPPNSPLVKRLAALHDSKSSIESSIDYVAKEKEALISKLKELNDRSVYLDESRKDILVESGGALTTLTLKVDSLKFTIGVCTNLVSDILHYIELHDLSASNTSKINKILKATLRRKRELQDEVCILLAYRREFKGVDSDKDLSFHRNRLEATRDYTPRVGTLEEVLSLDILRKINPESRVNLSRFNHITSKLK